MRTYFYEILEKGSETKYYQIESNMHMDIWYGLLYVVIEGWQELKLTDDKINELLESNNVGLLKRYRNGVFHYQKEYNDKRFENFFKESGTVEWIRSLNREMGRWFLENLRNK
ncbi:MAG: hypothetical protein KAT05_14070 [Spirochaetes bacterium]|nr:hypothetical protein [Spirochaetota bacterium]